LTAGPKESRAWTIPKGATAPQAAGVIHTDFERGFIKAEVVSFADLIAAGSMAAARAAGKARIEGKDYVMADGDVVEFRTGRSRARRLQWNALCHLPGTAPRLISAAPMTDKVAKGSALSDAPSPLVAAVVLTCSRRRIHQVLTRDLAALSAS
jgi:hypothetical protein